MAHRNDAMSQKQNSDRTSPNTILGFSRVKLPYEEVLMFQTVSRLLPEVSLILVTAVATHLVMSFAQTLMHYKLGHHPRGGKFFRNHINFHHTYYSKDHLVSRTYLGEEGNNTPFFFVPVFLVGGCAYFLLPLNLFMVMVIAKCSVVLRARLFRQGISRRAI